MALQYTLVFGILIVEIVLYSIISLPLPPSVRKPLLKSLNIPFHSERFQIFFRCIIGFIGVLFVDSLHRMNKVTRELRLMDNDFEPHHHMDPQPPMDERGVMTGSTRAEVQTRRFYAQRNVYLCGLTLFLTLIVKRTYDFVYELLAVKEEIAKQEKEKKVKDLDTVDDGKVKKVKDDIKNEDDRIANLKKQATGLEKEYDSLK